MSRTEQPSLGWLADPCRCKALCCDSDPDGPGVCKGLPLPKREPLVQVVLVDRTKA